MTAENKPQHHMAIATTNALKKIAEWQAKGLLKPDIHRKHMMKLKPSIVEHILML